jgi:hypothetical protein
MIFDPLTGERFLRINGKIYGKKETCNVTGARLDGQVKYLIKQGDTRVCGTPCKPACLHEPIC